MSAELRGGARTFVRSLNILLKFARLYEFGHVRTAAQFETTWKELRGALDDGVDHRPVLWAGRAAALVLNQRRLDQRRCFEA